ncbi:hypothetical protein [Comamonas sp. MYb396]|uniref:hypothetical protein n=1 Tax=Comamonas sp. MYb396 TaxID=2745302 RepID=UPI00309A0C16
MFSFLIVSNDINFSNCIFQVFCTMGAPKLEVDGRIFLEADQGMKHGWIACQRIENINDDYEEEELIEINKLVPNASFYLVEGRNEKMIFSNELIMKINPLCKVLVDNDHGLIADISVIKNRIKNNQDWLYSTN